MLKIPKESVRVVVGDVGGGFGMKTNLYPEDVVVAFAALDNLVKGAAGSALQNFNARFGYPETMGLEALPLWP